MPLSIADLTQKLTDKEKILAEMQSDAEKTNQAIAQLTAQMTNGNNVEQRQQVLAKMQAKKQDIQNKVEVANQEIAQLKTEMENINGNDQTKYKEQLDKDNVNIIPAPKPVMKLSFDKNGTCYLFIDSKTKPIVPTDVDDTQKFKKFVEKVCPRNGSLNIEVDENQKIVCAYTIDNETHKREEIKEIDKELTASIERVIEEAFKMQKKYSSSLPSKEVKTDNAFSANEVNDPNTVPSSSQSLNSSPKQVLKP